VSASWEVQVSVESEGVTACLSEGSGFRNQKHPARRRPSSSHPSRHPSSLSTFPDAKESPCSLLMCLPVSFGFAVSSLYATGALALGQQQQQTRWEGQMKEGRKEGNVQPTAGQDGRSSTVRPGGRSTVRMQSPWGLCKGADLGAVEGGLNYHVGGRVAIEATRAAAAALVSSTLGNSWTH